jgi:hypothetical protein
LKPETTGGNDSGRPPTARVAFVVVYTGTWPRWCQVFFDSVGRNSLIDLVLVCTSIPPCPLPGNVHIFPITVEELTSRLRLATGLKLNPITGHKLCDFRPFFGLAFRDLLTGYGFWGFCDVDMIFGDLSKLLTPEFLAQMDAFTAHNKQLVGHFTLLRNNERMNRLGFEMEDWQAACLSPANAMVDEKQFSDVLAKAADIKWVKTNTLASELDRTFCRFGITFGFRGEVAYLDADETALVEVNGNRVIYSDARRQTEVLYVHFMGLKHWWHWLDYRPGEKNSRFSRVGYGGPRNAQALLRFPWRQFWAVGMLLARTKSLSGGFLRKLLPSSTFLSVRRLILGRSRY